MQAVGAEWMEHRDEQLHYRTSSTLLGLKSSYLFVLPNILQGLAAVDKDKARVIAHRSYSNRPRSPVHRNACGENATGGLYTQTPAAESACGPKKTPAACGPDKKRLRRKVPAVGAADGG